ncbi:MAG TPA: hypothetical protein IAC66_07270 [Candidatus Aphodousia gallistercoris]|nr:hypothetical protein [Candidatus Aphodousia gallistercoris]
MIAGVDEKSLKKADSNHFTQSSARQAIDQNGGIAGIGPKTNKNLPVARRRLITLGKLLTNLSEKAKSGSNAYND